MQNISQKCLTYRGALVLAAAVMSSLISVPVHADDILSVAVPTVTFTGESVCGTSGTSVCIESFSASFEWDNTTDSVVPGTAEIDASGPLGSLTFYGPLFANFGSGELIGAIWDNSAGSGLTAVIETGPGGLVPGVYPNVGPFQPGDSGAGLGCFYVDHACVAEFLSGPTVESSPSPMVVTGVPEPDSLSLLFAALPMLLAFRFRRHATSVA